METVKYTFVEDELDSSALSTLYYDCFGRRLFVEFHNGKVAGYNNVTPKTVQDLLDAESIGSFFAKYIKPAYTGISTSGVTFAPLNAWSDINYDPKLFESPAGIKLPEPEPDTEYVEPEEEDANGTYEISFMVEGKTTFSAPKGDIVRALDLFVGSFAEKNDAIVRVRSIKEVE